MEDQSEKTSSTVRVRYWGSRGSVPAPGTHTQRYGGNTPCVEVETDTERFILDAGTGIRELGLEMLSTPDEKPCSLLLTHFHWDHIQGFPFFGPAQDPAFHLRILAPVQGGRSVESLLGGQMDSAYFPIPYGALKAHITHRNVREGSMEEGNARIVTLQMRHPSFTVGYRLEFSHCKLAYIPDNELVGGNHPTPEGWEDHLVEFISGTDLLIHDAMYTDSEYASRQGWGHSTFSQALDLAQRGRVKRLHFFHHAPSRSDGELDRIVGRYQGSFEAVRDSLEVGAASEGSRLILH